MVAASVLLDRKGTLRALLGRSLEQTLRCLLELCQLRLRLLASHIGVHWSFASGTCTLIALVTSDDNAIVLRIDSASPVASSSRAMHDVLHLRQGQSCEMGAIPDDRISLCVFIERHATVLLCIQLLVGYLLDLYLRQGFVAV